MATVTVSGGSIQSAAFARGCAALVGKARSGISPITWWSCGDSTANDLTDTIPELFAKVGAAFPAYTLTSLPWDDALTAFHPFMPSIALPPRYGTAGDAYYTSAAGKYVNTPDSAALSVTGDLFVMQKVNPATWNPAGVQDFSSKFLAAGQRSWRWYLQAQKLIFGYTNDGTAERTFTSTANVPFADGTAGYVAVWLDVDNGAGGSTVTFYTSTDGFTLTQLGNPVTIATALTIFDSTADVELGTRGGGVSEPFAGSIHYFEMWSGNRGAAGSFPVAILDIDDYDPNLTTITDKLGNVWTPQGSPTFAGAPGMCLVNCAVAGTAIAYASTTNYAAMVVGRTPDLCSECYGHNDTTTDYRTAVKTLTDKLAVTWPSAPIMLVTQNPEEAPRTATQINNQLLKMSQVQQFAARSGFDLLDGIRAFQNANNNAVYLNPSAGVHPSQAGYDLWRDYGYATCFQPYILPS